MISLHPQIKNR